ncbi:hypothetical protein OPV22_029979 [Ensete ventricosum]|uniref:Uncharacterized protein n=1 Tax=Ensete ventricosum TaxID=4639 RepID=A0A426ZFF2_ENSVE|nr:hypothetical protein OPV22_029979 [Ensete ventricosum]RRT62697.1 hypothetical protein B296_00029755 [Ensete ventricosum]RWW21539.1 hypothetical protein GW17_00014304 [Ensete ventricosum]RWW78004.1 hypothetical protein BHE74_00013788 [Ensete ventricosum]RZS05862.1 hypothetical protein BHM03_00036419 [Ensete ventricosum]
MATPPPPLHLLRLVMSCRKITAEVIAPQTSTIVAMASSDEPEFLTLNRARMNRPTRLSWDARVAARVGEKLGIRLRQIGVSNIEIDPLEFSRAPRLRRPAASLFDSVERAGICVAGSEKLHWP